MSFFNTANRLSPTDRNYLQSLNIHLWGAYQEDLAKGDITTGLFLGNKDKYVEAVITANQNGLLAGVEETKWFLGKLKIKIIQAKRDGEQLKKRMVIMRIGGRAGHILAAERTLLNLLQRMSGIATLTNRLARRLPKNIKLLATRKTLWGAMDKKAVAIGGGETHRLNLSDAILIKDNHLKISENWKKDLTRTLLSCPQSRFIEVEIQTEKELRQFLEVYEQIKSKLSKKQIVAVMLDNFSPREIKKVIRPLITAGLPVEVSGGVNESNLPRYNITGVSAVSSGALTAKAENLDFSLQITSVK